MSPVISARGVHKHYGKKVALDNINVQIDDAMPGTMRHVQCMWGIRAQAMAGTAQSRMNHALGVKTRAVGQATI